MHIAHHGYSAVVVLLAVSVIALAVPDNRRRLAVLATGSLLAAFLYLLWMMLYDR